jgi:N4-gp56 family major capsid protein
MGQEYGTASLGGALSQAYLTDWLRYVSQPMTRFRQLCDVKEAIGTGKGNTFNWDQIANIATQGTTLVETDTVPASNFTVTKNTCIVYEFGNSIPLTRLLNEMSQHEVKEIIRKSLANDMVKTIDQYIWNQAIVKTPLVYQADGGTNTALIALMTDGTGDAGNAATCWLNTNYVIQIVDSMKERNIPAFDGEDYVCIGHPSTFTSLRNQLISVNQYTETGYKKILNGEIGRFGGVRFVEQTHVAKVTPTYAGAGSWAAFIGGEAVVEAISVPEEVIEKEVTDYKRSMGLAWYMIAGFTSAFPHSYSSGSANSRIALWWPNATNPVGMA